MLKNRKYGFTLVELLASIVVLAIILVIAVPKVMNIINDAKKGVFANSVKLIASGAEQKHAENKVMGIDDKITCESVAQINSEDYKLCEISFEKDEARVTVIGDGKYNGLSVVYASKTNAVAQDGEPERLYTFDDVYEIVDSLTDRIEELENNVSTNSSKIESLGDGANSEEIENLQNQINTSNDNINKNKTAISNLTNKENTNNVFLQTYPVGSIYVTNNSANPGTKFGGTWVAFGAGRTLVGVDSSQTEFASVGKTGGAKTHVHGSLNSKNGTLEAMIGSSKGNADELAFKAGNSNSPILSTYSIRGASYYEPTLVNSHNTVVYGSTSSASSLAPYITVYMWKRTA